MVMYLALFAIFYEEEDRWVRRIVVYCVEFSLMNAW